MELISITIQGLTDGIILLLGIRMGYRLIKKIKDGTDNRKL